MSDRDLRRAGVRRSPIAIVVLLLSGCGTRYLQPAPVETFDHTPARIARGEYLVEVVAACGVCHSGRESGDFVFDGESTALHLAGGYGLPLPEMGIDLWFPNLTPDPETGLGRWSDGEVIRAVRDGLSRDGRRLVPAMPYRSYRALSDEDARSIVAYLRSRPAVRAPAPSRPSKVAGLPGFLLAHGAEHEKPVRAVPEPDRKNPIAYGGYLVRVAGCPDCHARKPSGVLRKSSDALWMAGGAWDDLPGVGRAYMRNLTPDGATGLGAYDGKALARAMRNGMRLDGKKMAPPMSLYMAHWSALEETDLQAMVAYLQSLPAARNAVPERRLLPEIEEAFR